MRHMMFGGGMAHGFAGFMLFHMIRRMMGLVVMVALVGLVFYLWQRNRNQDRW